jgi:hypothetical protein
MIGGTVGSRQPRGICTLRPVRLLQRGYAAVSEKPNSKTPPDPGNDLYERARTLKESLARLLEEINEVLEKTKHGDNGENQRGPASTPHGDALGIAHE